MVACSAVPGVGVQRSTDAGGTWSIVSAINDPFLTRTPRIELAIAGKPYVPGGTLVVYVAVTLGRDASVHRTEDDGATWQHMGYPATNELGLLGTQKVGLFPGDQASTHFSMAVDPSDPRRVYVGGDRQPHNIMPTASGTTDYSGRLLTALASPGPTMEWTPLVGVGAGGTSPHADSRFITFDAVGNLLEGDDGGIYRLTSPTQPSIRKWRSLNGDLRVNELYSAAWDSHNDNVIAGTQNVGSVEQITQSIDGTPAVWRDARLIGFFNVDVMTKEGDGGAVAVDARSKPGTAIRYTMGNNLQLFFRRDYAVPTPGVVPAWLTFGSENGLPNPFGGLHSADTVLMSGFRIVPFELNAELPNRLAIGGNALYESNDFGVSVTITDTPLRGTRIGALAFGGWDTSGTPKVGAVYHARGNEVSMRDDVGMN